jgi:hypothetical protein
MLLLAPRPLAPLRPVSREPVERLLIVIDAAYNATIAGLQWLPWCG